MRGESQSAQRGEQRPNTGMNPTRSAIAPRAGYADR
jgi:hypothetical protein